MSSSSLCLILHPLFSATIFDLLGSKGFSSTGNNVLIVHYHNNMSTAADEVVLGDSPCTLDNATDLPTKQRLVITNTKADRERERKERERREEEDHEYYNHEESANNKRYKIKFNML
jgi:hypothetical protein